MAADKIKTLNLTSQESRGVVRSFSATSSLTFYTASSESERAAAIEFLKTRTALVVHRNGWLGGRIRRIQRNDLKVEYCTSSADSSHSFAVQAHHHTARSYEDCVKSAAPFVVRRGIECADTNEPLFRVTVLAGFECSASGEQGNGRYPFALVLSMCHLLGDAATFAQICGMLSQDKSDDDVITLLDRPDKPARPPAALAAATGKKREIRFIENSGLYFRITRLLTRLSCTRSVTQYVLEVDSKVVAEKKAAAVGIDGPAFVSTNDILHAWFAKASGAIMHFMLLNLRGKRIMPEIDRIDRAFVAGNFVAPLPMFGEVNAMDVRNEVCAVWCKVAHDRSKVKRPRREELPSLFGMLSGACCTTTNLAGLQSELALLGCPALLYLPVKLPEDADLPRMTVFRARPSPSASSGLAVLITGSNFRDPLSSAPDLRIAPAPLFPVRSASLAASWWAVAALLGGVVAIGAAMRGGHQG